VDTFRRGLEARNRGDIEALLETLDAEVEWHPALPAALGGKATIYRGHQGIREMLQDFYEVFAKFPEIRDLGDRVVAIGRFETGARRAEWRSSRLSHT
jgi:ketosteroid isomerase-like protein